MGKALAGNLAPRGLATIVYDLDEAAIREVLASGARPAGSAREVAQNADVIGICVPADSHVRAVLCGAEGVFAHAAAGAVVAIHSTVHPSTIEEMAAEGAPRGVAKMPGYGPTWVTAYVSLPDKSGTPRLVGSYSKIKPPLEALFGVPHWTVAVVQPTREIHAPIDGFLRQFGLCSWTLPCITDKRNGPFFVRFISQ